MEAKYKYKYIQYTPDGVIVCFAPRNFAGLIKKKGMIAAMRENKVCPECGKSFHACDQCGLPHIYLLYYCSNECYMKSLTFEGKVEKLKRLIRESKVDIYKLLELSEFIEENNDDITLLLSNDDVKEEWYWVDAD